MIEEWPIKFLSGGQNWYVSIVTTTVLFIALLINRYSDGLLPLLEPILLISNRITGCFGLRTHSATSYLNQFRRNLINIWWFVSYSVSAATSATGKLGTGTCRSADRSGSYTQSKCCGNLRGYHHNHWETYVRSKQVTLLKVTYAPLYVSDIPVLTVYLKLINCTFQIFPLLFLICLPASCVTMFGLSALTGLRSCNLCNSACFIWSTHFIRPRFTLFPSILTAAVFSWQTTYVTGTCKLCSRKSWVTGWAFTYVSKLQTALTPSLPLGAARTVGYLWSFHSY